MGGIIGNYRALADTIVDQLTASNVLLSATPKYNASICVRNSSLSAIEVDGNGKLVEGAASFTLGSTESVRLWYNGTIWKVIGRGDSWETLEQWVSPPAAYNSTGIKGQMAFDGSYLYQCVETNTWIRQPVETSF